MTLYRLGSMLLATERERFGIHPEDSTEFVRAQLTGEVRHPKYGEWYVPEGTRLAFRTPASCMRFRNMRKKHRIARLVLTEVTTVTVIVQR
jgi:hypothetical protein